MIGILIGDWGLYHLNSCTGNLQRLVTYVGYFHLTNTCSAWQTLHPLHFRRYSCEVFRSRRGHPNTAIAIDLEIIYKVGEVVLDIGEHVLYLFITIGQRRRREYQDTAAINTITPRLRHVGN